MTPTTDDPTAGDASKVVSIGSRVGVPSAGDTETASTTALVLAFKPREPLRVQAVAVETVAERMRKDPESVSCADVVSVLETLEKREANRFRLLSEQLDVLARTCAALASRDGKTSRARRVARARKESPRDESLLLVRE